MSFGVERYHLDYEALRKLAEKALVDRDINGACLIFHGFRKTRDGHWYWSVHFHVLGFLSGGYTCRSCVKKLCSKCHGFEAHTREVFKRDGIIVKVAVDKEGNADVRKSVFKTAQYQLSHATIRTDVKRPHCVTWMGTCSYRKLKVKIEKRAVLCPICQNELVKVQFVGSLNLDNFNAQRFVLNRGSPNYKPDFFDVVVDGKGRKLWVEDEDAF